MKENLKNSNKIKIIIITAFIAGFVAFVIFGAKIIVRPSNFFVVANGSLFLEEPAEGYIIRDETILQGENYKNGMVKVLSDGEKTAKSEMVFRYYSNSEETILKQISEIDEQISEAIENSGMTIASSDISSLEKQIESTVEEMYNLNYLKKIRENKNNIEAYISKKAQITGTLSPSDSYVKKLADQRAELEKELSNSSEIMYAPVSGMVSYRIDGLEQILLPNNFDYLNSELLEGFDLKAGAVIPLSDEKGKIVNNFECFLACPIDTEKAMMANVGDKVTLRFSNSGEINAEIIYIKEEDTSRILVFKITEDITNLVEYRKVSFDIIWWKYTGLKISNSCLIEENDLSYIEKNQNGYKEKVLVKVLRQNDTYSIIENYKDEELINLGYNEEEIAEAKNKKVKLYDQIILH